MFDNSFIIAHDRLIGKPLTRDGAGFIHRSDVLTGHRSLKHLDLLQFVVIFYRPLLFSIRLGEDATHASWHMLCELRKHPLECRQPLGKHRLAPFILYSSNRCMKYEGSARTPRAPPGAPLRQRPSSSSSCGRHCPLAPSSPGRRVLLAIACHLSLVLLHSPQRHRAGRSPDRPAPAFQAPYTRHPASRRLSGPSSARRASRATRPWRSQHPRPARCSA
jgi:hypothetical protein